MTDSTQRTFTADFKRFFLRGLVVLLPSILTLWIVVKAYQFVDGAIAEPINQSIRMGMGNLAPHWEPLRKWFDDESEFDDERTQFSNRALDDNALRTKLRDENIAKWWSAHWYMDLIGLIVAIVIVYIAGRLLGGFIGRRVYGRIERFITTVPVFKQVYPYIKQIVDFLFSDEPQMKFNRVVVVEYPRKGIWSLGFHTGGTMRTIGERVGDAITIFIPSSPTPFTGYTITVPRNEVIEIPISVEEAIRFTVSGGVLIPQQQLVESAPNQTPLIPQEKLPDGLVAVSGESARSQKESAQSAKQPQAGNKTE